MADDESLRALCDLLNLQKKREVERMCASMEITSEGFFHLLIAGRAGAVANLEYACHFTQYVPEHLEPTEEENQALGSTGVGPLEGKALKLVRKVSAIFNERRVFAAHLFYVPGHAAWHMFYFDQRDTQKRGNHWKHGPHIHYTSDLIVTAPLSGVWSAICQERPVVPKSLHLRYKDVRGKNRFGNVHS